jgi:hypothetical protein
MDDNTESTLFYFMGLIALIFGMLLFHSCVTTELRCKAEIEKAKIEHGTK